jgi:TP901 family phage tail tape measure protein
MSVQELGPAMDKLVAVDAKGASSVNEIATAMQRSSAVASDLGVSYDKLVAITNTISSVTRLPAETVGTGVRAILTRMSAVKAGANVSDEGEDISKVETALKAQGIALRDNSGEFRDFSTVLEETAKRYQELGVQGKTVEQSQLAQAFAGQRQVILFRSLMNNQDLYNESLQVEADSIGRVNERYEKYKNSVEGTSETAKASWQGLWQAIVDPQLLIALNNLSTTTAKFFKDAFNGTSDWYNVLRLIPTPISGIFAAMKSGVGGIKALNDWLTIKPTTIQQIEEATKKVTELKNAQKLNSSEISPDEIKYQNDQIKALEDKIKVLQQLAEVDKDESGEMQRLTNMNREHTLAVKNDYNAEQDAINAADNLKQSSDKLTDSFMKSNNAMGGIMSDYEKYGQITADQAMQMTDAGYGSALMFDQQTGAITINEQALRNNTLAMLDKTTAEAYDAYMASVHAAATEDDTKKLLDKWQALVSIKQLMLENTDAAIVPTTKYIESASSANSEAKDILSDYKDILKDVVDMIKQESQDQIDSLKEQEDSYKKIIDAKKKSIDLAKQESDYQTELKDKNKTLADIQNELFELQNDNSQSGMAKKLALKDKETKAIEDINKTQADKSVTDQKQALDDDYDNFKTSQDAKIKDLENYLKDTGTITATAIDLLTNHAATTYNELLEWNRKFGSGVDSDISGKWDNAMKAMAIGIQELEKKASASLGGITSSINKVKDAATDLANSAATKFHQMSNEVAGSIENLSNTSATKFHQMGNDIDNVIEKLDSFNTKLAQSGGTYFPGSSSNAPAGWNSPTYQSTNHDGAKSGFVGGLPTLQSNEVFAKLLTGELVVNQNQMSQFINKTLPDVVSTASQSMGGINLGGMVFNVSGNLDKTVIPQLESAVLKIMNNATRNLGFKPNAKSFSV